MGLVKRIVNWTLGRKVRLQTAPAHSNHSVMRRCHFEIMEPRQVFSVSPVVVGVTYHEGDIGQDVTPDHFEVTFQGGSSTTQLTQFVIHGDQDQNGVISDGDMLFDVTAGGVGTGQHHQFLFDAAASSGLSAADISSFQVSPDGLKLTVNVRNFTAGDKLAFTIDVDEVEGLLLDKIASGVEFETTLFQATLVDAHYNFSRLGVNATTTLENEIRQNQVSGVFFDHYDDLLAAGGQVAGSLLSLRADNDQGQADRSAAAIDAYELVPKNVTLSGHVFEDPGLCCDPDSEVQGIAGVRLTLQKLNSATGRYESVAQTTTDTQGFYEFGENLNLKPGVYRVVEAQPSGYLDVSATAGKVAGTPSGIVQDDNAGNANVIANIQIPLGGTAATDYDFLEVKPVSLSGKVWHDRNDDGQVGAGEEGLANVLIRVTRLGSADGSSSDPFAGAPPIFVRTDANGNYQVTGLPPGLYEIVEINSYPPTENPLAGFVDGRDSLGQVGGSAAGLLSNDSVTQIKICAGQAGGGYNFGELKPTSISGYVSVATPEGNCLEPGQANFVGLAGVTIQLYDSSGSLIATTTTNSQGKYEFNNLRNGTYTVVEVQPSEYLDGDEHLGQVAGATSGTISGNDRFSQIVLSSGQNATRYDFCEHRPAQICGTVYHDRNNNGIQDVGEEGIANTRAALYGSDGQLVEETLTDPNGDYCFQNLIAGQYFIRETQPTGFLDGRDSVGQIAGAINGQLENDELRNIVIRGGQQGVEYNFGELKTARLSGYVLIDKNGDCLFQAAAGDSPLANVTIELLNESGSVLASTRTAADGSYVFDNLLPGTYSLRQVQPSAYFNLGQAVGTVGGQVGSGNASGLNSISGIEIQSGQNLVQYNFCEDVPAEIHGRVWEDGPAFQTRDGSLPEGYRGQRDGIYQAGVDNPLSGVRMQLYHYLDPSTGELNPRPVTLQEVLPGVYPHLGTDPNAPVWVLTDAQGEYHFTGLKAGSYVVLQAQPIGYSDANDIVGSTTGFTYNSELEAAFAPSAVTSIFSTQQVMDSIVNIKVEAGGISVQNNFTEVRSLSTPTNPYLPPIDPRPLPPSGPGPGLPGAFLPGLAGMTGFAPFDGLHRVITGSEAGGAPTPFTWHLSVINAGTPRAIGESDSAQTTWLQAAFINSDDWHRFEMDRGEWEFASVDTTELKKLDRALLFGMLDGIPLAGDFDGDGTDEVAVYKEGYWLIDINHSGTWDSQDLLARLGDEDDQPVIGDWDGDGKEDIGIYGPMWEKDPEAIEHDPGLPNPDNLAYTHPKNMPPTVAESTSGARTMKLTAHGRQRTDLVDHVFGIDDYRHHAVTGDWNGNGIRSIGTFDGGAWRLDLNGDGRFDHADAYAVFGNQGDIPVVGDFDGDGIEEIAVYRAGLWIVDSNGNRQMDDTDRRFEYGSASDQPVVCDWNGDGRDEVGLYRNSQRVF